MKVKTFLPVFDGFYGTYFECDYEEFMINDYNNEHNTNYDYSNFADKPSNGVNTYKKIKYSNSNKLIAMFLFPKTETSLVFYEDNPKTFYKKFK